VTPPLQLFTLRPDLMLRGQKYFKFGWVGQFENENNANMLEAANNNFS